MPKVSPVDHDRDASAAERQADLPEIARATEERSTDAAREGARPGRGAASAAADTLATARRSGEATADAGRMLVETLGEQARHNMQAAAALARAVKWTDVVDLQRDFIGGSVERMHRFGECYRQLLWAGTTAAPVAFKP
jgi:hypothetical protein